MTADIVDTRTLESIMTETLESEGEVIEKHKTPPISCNTEIFCGDKV